MSLSGIFDPVVRAHFKKLFGVGSSGDGGAYPDNIRAVSSPTYYLETGSFEGMPIYKVGEALPVSTKDAVKGFVTYLSESGGTVINLSEDSGFGFLIEPTGDTCAHWALLDENTGAMILSIELPEDAEMLGISTGLWVSDAFSIALFERMIFMAVIGLWLPTYLT